MAIPRVPLSGGRCKQLVRLSVCAIFAELALDITPDVGAGFQGGLQENTGLIRNVLEIANQGRAIGAGGEVGTKLRLGAQIAVSFLGKHVRQLLLELSTGQGFVIGIRVTHD
jgi:hypothetical protein